MLKKLRQLGKSGALFSFLLAFSGSAIAVFSATQLGFGSTAEIGSGFFPFIVGIVLLVTGLTSGISSLDHGDAPSGRESSLTPQSIHRVLYLVMSYVAWLLLIPFLGYVPTTLVISIVMAKTIGLEGWGRPILLSLGLALFLYFLFEVLFYVDLPRGILEKGFFL